MNSVPDCMVFAWGLASNSTGNKQYYESFSLNGEFYRPGEDASITQAENVAWLSIF